MKKAGTIVGVLVILLALGIYWWADGKEKSKTEQKPVTTQQVQDNSKQQQNNEQQVQQPVSQQNNNQNQQTTIETNPQVTPTYTEVDVSQLGTPHTTKEEVMVVSNKRVILLDGNPNSTSSKQIAYSLDLMTADKQPLTHFVGKSVYDSFSVGNQLKVTYEVYKNVNNIKFPSIISVELVQ